MYNKDSIINTIRNSVCEDWDELGYTLGHGEEKEDNWHYCYVYTSDVRLQVDLKEEKSEEEYDHLSDEHLPVEEDWASIYFDRNLVETFRLLDLNDSKSILICPSGLTFGEPSMTQKQFELSKAFTQMCYGSSLSRSFVEDELDILLSEN